MQATFFLSVACFLVYYFNYYETMELEHASRALSAIAQPIRLHAFRVLVVAGDAGMNAGKLAETLDVAKPTLTFHLKELSHAGLVSSHRDGRSVIYKMEYDAMRILLDYLAKDCCAGHPDLRVSNESQINTCCSPKND